MSSLDQARDTQLRNIEAKTGKSLTEFRSTIAASGLSKHGEIRTMLMGRYGLGYGDANSLVHFALSSDGQSAAKANGASIGDIAAEIYSGNKAALRPIHDAVIAAIRAFGSFETVPKKGYVSLRRKKQFAMVGPGTKSRLEVGLNMKDVKATPRLVPLSPGGMCQYRVYLVNASEVDRELVTWIRRAYDASG